MAAITMSSNLDNLSQPPSQASSPSAAATSFPGQQSLPLRIVQNVYNQGSVPGTPTSSNSNGVSELPSGMKYADYIRTWNDSHVSQWLADIKCGHHTNTFKANDIRGDVLLELDQPTLKEMGVTSVGDRLRILNGVKALRQKCAKRTDRSSIYGASQPRVIVNGQDKDSGHKRAGSGSSPTSRLASRRLDAGRPAPLQLNSAAGQSNLPHLIRDSQNIPESARSIPSVRPLPQPTQSQQSAAAAASGTSNGAPSNSQSSGSRTGALPLPPVPRGQPPPPPAPSARHTNRTHLGPSGSGRGTPTLEAPEYTLQPLPPAPGGHLTPLSGQSWAGYGLPPDPRAGGATKRSQSPLPAIPPRTASRSPNPTFAHGRSLSGAQSTSSPVTKVAPRPSTTGHPYSQASLQVNQTQANILSPIAESFQAHTSVQSSPSPPTAYSVGRGPFNRPNTPSYNIAPSLVDLRRKLVKFQLADEGHSCTINVEDCAGGIEVLEKALKKFGKSGSRSSDADSVMNYVGTDEGGLSVDGWGVYLDWGHGSTPAPMSEAELLAVCHAPPDDPAREHGLTLRRTGKAKRSKALAAIFGEAPPPPGQQSPTSPLFVGPNLPTGHEDADGNLLTPGHTRTFSEAQAAKNMKRASSISILSGLGVRDPEKALESPSSPTQPSAPHKSASGGGLIKAPSKLRNFFGQRPPSELITTHLSEYFPFTEKKVLERTARHSMLRASGLSGFSKRDSTTSTISFAPPPPSRFSVSTMSSGRSKRYSTRSFSSSIHPTPNVEDKDKDTSEATQIAIVEETPRMSLSTDDGRSVDLDSETEGENEEADENETKAHLLPPVNISFESFSASMNDLTGGQLSRRSTSTSQSGSKRMSYITELRSKRDVSDTASLMTVDEITAEVESRQETMVGEEGSATDGWTKVDMDDDEIPAAPVDVKAEEEEDEEEAEDEDEEEEEEDEAEEEGSGKAIASGGIKWIKGALIGAGSFGQVYLGMDAASGLLMAVKQVELPTGASFNNDRKQTMLTALEREIELLKDLEHEHIVQYLYSSADDTHFNIFLEYVPGGSVTALLRNYGAFEEPLVRTFVRQILEGLDYVHERGIVHRDIKGANVLVDNKGGIKISDFGISKKLEDNLMPGNRLHRPSLQGSVFWMAPEVVKQTAYTKKADIWSVGCLVVEMFTGEHPWAQLNQMQAIFKIGSSAKPPIPSDISAEAQTFLELCFEANHEARPSAGDLLQHPWLKKPAGKASKAAALKDS